MDTAQSRQHTNLADTIRRYASSPCWMHEVDPGYLGYWSQREVLVFLKSLLERERIGTRAFADIGKAADLHTADLILDSELAQGSICVQLRETIATRGAVAPTPHKRVTNEGRAKCSLEQAVAFANSHQAGLVQTIEEAVLKILDSELNARLMSMLQLHRKQIEQLKTLLT